MDHIRSILPKVLRKRGLNQAADAALVVYISNQWITKEFPEFSSKLKAVQLKDSVLIIATEHSIAAQECQQRSSDLLFYLGTCVSSPPSEIRLIRS